MKVGVISFSGNVGKSTLSRYLLAPRMNDAQIIPVESINSDGTEDQVIRGKQFDDLLEAMAVLDDVVVDIGASNVEDFCAQMKVYRGSHEDFDYFVIPTASKAKIQRDTVSTIEALAAIGVPPKKIRLVMNMVELDEVPERVFSGLFDYHASDKTYTLRPDAVIHVSDLYSKIKATQQSIAQVLADTTDYKAKIKQAQDPAEKLRFAQLLSIKRLAAGVSEELDAVFKTLFK